MARAKPKVLCFVWLYNRRTEWHKCELRQLEVLKPERDAHYRDAQDKPKRGMYDCKRNTGDDFHIMFTISETGLEL